MSGSLQIARLFGIPVQLHWSFCFVVLFILYMGFEKNMGAGQLLWLSLAALGLFVSILLHEFGHALTARRYGVETKDIILLPIGGLARLTKLPEQPFQEFVVAIAGPCVNVALSLLLSPYLFLVLVPGLEDRPLPTPDSLIGDFFFFVPFMFSMNVGLAIFNLLPAFPMDGGRVLRALLAIKLGRFRATQIAVVLGQLIATAMMCYGVWSNNYSYAFIGIFIFFTASKEFRWVKTERVLKQAKTGSVARTDFTKLYRNTSMQVPYSLLLRNQERHFLVFDEQDHQVIGTLSEGDILKGLKAGSPDAMVSAFYTKGLETVETESDLKTANDKMRSSGTDILAVMDKGELVGVVDADMIQHYLKLRHRLPAIGAG
ncbi:MAG: site-2 protease family protein [Saprospiraceae bacterium]